MSSFLATRILMHHLMVCLLVRTILLLLHHLVFLFYRTVATLVAHRRPYLVIENIVVFGELVCWNEGLAILSEVWWHLKLGHFVGEWYTSVKVNVLAELRVILELLLDGEQPGGEVARILTGGGGKDPLLVDLAVDE
jgi:hypothetical protein